MRYYILLCRTVTRAQRTAQFLQRRGLRCTMRRAPRELSAQGCAYGLQMTERELPAALQLLRQARLLPEAVYLRQGEEYREVAFS